MTNSEAVKYVLEEIQELLKEAAEECGMAEKGLTNTDMYYMNGNDGTEFDWHLNDRVCEFALQYPEELTDMLAARLLVDRYGDATLYMYEPDAVSPFKELEYKNKFDEDDIKMLAEYLEDTRDKKKIWDERISAEETKEYPDWEYSGRLEEYFEDYEDYEEDDEYEEDEEEDRDYDNNEIDLD